MHHAGTEEPVVSTLDELWIGSYAIERARYTLWNAAIDDQIIIRRLKINGPVVAAKLRMVWEGCCNDENSFLAEIRKPYST
jgi:hypothetical protein